MSLQDVANPQGLKPKQVSDFLFFCTLMRATLSHIANNDPELDKMPLAT